MQLRSRFQTVLAILPLFSLCAVGAELPEKSEKELRVASAVNLKRLGVAMHTHHGQFKMLPTPAIKKDDKPLLSWRVKLLPYLGEEVLYVQFHLDEPWDSEHNKTLIPKMPAVLTSPYETAEMVAKGLTAYQVPICKGSLFDEDAPFNLAQARDGASHTILVVETNPDQAVIWTKPDDWKVDAKKPHTGVVREKGKGFHALFADAAVHLMDDTMSAENLLLLLGRDDGKNAPTKSLFLKEE